MATWKKTLSFGDFYHDADLTLADKATHITGRLGYLQRDYPDDSELNDIIDEFKHFENEHGVEEFDGIMARLYDWCDDERVWIST